MRVFFFLIGFLFIGNVNAQKFDCAAKTKEYQNLFLLKKVNDSYAVWSEVRKNCPKDSETLYSEGLQILQYQVDNAASSEEKEKLVNNVMKLYDQYNANFPLTTADFQVRKAMFLYNNSARTKEQMDTVFTLLENGFTNASKSITDANAIYIYFSLYFDKYKAGDKTVTAAIALDKYSLVNSLLTELEVSNPNNSNDYKTAQRGIQALAKELTSCPNLTAYYEKNYPTNTENSAWIANAVSSLTENCSTTPIYFTLAEANYKNKVTSKSAYYMGIANVKQRKFTEAITYFTEAESLETNPLEKAKLDYSLATGLLSNDKAKAKELLNKAITLDPTMGRAYLFLADLYSNSADECGKTDFERKAVNYLAIATLKKAATFEPRLKASADKMTENFAKKSLTPAEITKAKMNGKSITIGCWINETITFPSK
ncbi:tetratricopeptide repeat protein [Flavobacterium sp.]|uniref:tetratricopeptide repeat protein n=1 Tax=Flavobacterium sp. TaxID=239 RepID=UPI002FD9DCBC